VKTKNDLQNKINDLISSEIDRLKQVKSMINITSLEVIEIQSISNYSLEQFSTILPKKGTITIYVIKSNSKLNIEELNKKRDFWFDKGYQMSKVNNENLNSNKENCLYVGQSKNIADRLKQHLFLSRKSTYALRLDKLLEKGSILVEIYGFNNKPNEVQIFEDLLWNHYRPLLGKQGKK
jgi:hypothetical protein